MNSVGLIHGHKRREPNVGRLHLSGGDRDLANASRMDWLSRAAEGLSLDGWALDGAVAAKNAAVSRLWTQQCLARLAFVKELTGIRWHLKCDRVAALGACQC